MPRPKSIKTLFRESKKKTAHFDMYQVDGSDAPIHMSLFPGDTGQSAVTDIYLEDHVIEKGIVGTIENFLLGTNQFLDGKFLEVYTVISDVSNDTDLTSFEFHLEGGIIPYDIKMEKTVQNQGDSVIYKMTIFFFH